MGNDVEVILKGLATQGVLGVLLVLCLLVIWKMALYIRDQHEKRITEGLANQRILIELTQAVRDLSNVYRERGVK